MVEDLLPLPPSSFHLLLSPSSLSPSRVFFFNKLSFRAISPDKAETGLSYLQCMKDGVPVETIPLDTQSFYVLGRHEHAGNLHE
jgi:hypothetical protein